MGARVICQCVQENIRVMNMSVLWLYHTMSLSDIIHHGITTNHHGYTMVKTFDHAHAL